MGIVRLGARSVELLSPVQPVGETRRTVSWAMMGALAVLGVCCVVVAHVQYGDLTLQELAAFPTKLFDASVYTPPPSRNPTPVPSINIGGEPVIAPGSFITESTNNTIATLQQKMRHDMQVVNMIPRNSARSRKYVDDRQAGGGNLAGFDHKKIFWVPTKFNGVPHDLAAYGHLSGGGIHGTPAQVAQIQQT